MLAPALASRFARIALDNVVREYPNKPEHVLDGPGDVSFPRTLHPAFYGSYDWHSCVHMHWLLARILRGHPQLGSAGAIAEVFDRHLAREFFVARPPRRRPPQRRDHRCPHRRPGYRYPSR